MLKQSYENDLKPINDILNEINKSEFIIKSGYEMLIGFQYADILEPFVTFKNSTSENFYLVRIAEKMCIPCLENKLLTRQIYSNVKEQEYIMDKYSDAFFNIYERLENNIKQNDSDDFTTKLNTEVDINFYRAEKDIFQKMIRKCSKKVQKTEDFEDIINTFQKEIFQLSEKYGFLYQKKYYEELKLYEFYLETYIEEYKLYRWHFLFINENEQKIYITGNSFFTAFDFSDANITFA